MNLWTKLVQPQTFYLKMECWKRSYEMTKLRLCPSITSYLKLYLSTPSYLGLAHSPLTRLSATTSRFTPAPAPLGLPLLRALREPLEPPSPGPATWPSRLLCTRHGGQATRVRRAHPPPAHPLHPASNCQCTHQTHRWAWSPLLPATPRRLPPQSQARMPPALGM